MSKANKFDKAVSELEAVKSPFDVMQGYKPMRSNAKNIVNIYGDDDYQQRFHEMVTFNTDARSDQEKHRLILQAIDSAIHYYKKRSEHEGFNSQTNPSSVQSRVLGFIPTIILIVLSLLVYNNFTSFNWYITKFQFGIIGVIVIVLVAALITKKLNDKWTNYLLVILAIILQVILKQIDLV